MLIGLSDLLWEAFATIMNVTNEKNKKMNFFADPILVSINCDLSLPLDKITYFDDIIRFNCMNKTVYRVKTRYFVDENICHGKIMLPANSLYFSSKCFLSSVSSVKMFPLLTILIVLVNNKIGDSVAR